MTALDIDASSDGDHVRLMLTGDLDARSADELLSCTVGQLARPEINHVTADLAGLAFVDSSGLRTLVFSHRHADGLGKTFRIQGQHGTIAEIIDITGLADMLTAPKNRPDRR